MNDIVILGAREGNLKDVTVSLPKGKLVVLTGPSGSGKSTLALDVLFTECQRQYLEAMGMQGIRKPDVERVRGASPAVSIAARCYAKNPRSSVGTVTGIYTDLRMVYEKLSARRCPACGALIKASDCRETTEKAGQDFHVYMDCRFCGHRMDKLTRSHFSFNTREGACPVCQGMGHRYAINESRAVDDARSLEDGAVGSWAHLYKEYQIASLYKAFEHYALPYAPGTPVGAFTPPQRALLLYGVGSREARSLLPDIAPPRTVATGRFEGVYPALTRKLSEKGGDAKTVLPYFDLTPCPECRGERLNEPARSATVMDTRIGELAALPLEGLKTWLDALSRSLSEAERTLVDSYLLDLTTKLRRIANVGLDYLTPDRQTMTLSGGEAQRVKLAATLASELSGIVYILDEPTIGLHPHDTNGLIEVLKRLRDLDNTVIVIEHDVDVMRAADHIVDMGPGAGRFGGQVVGLGTLAELMDAPSSVTGAYLRAHERGHPRAPRSGCGFIEIRNAAKHNLQRVNVRIPIGVLTSVTGVSGSGKSTLVFDVLGALGPEVSGAGQFDRVLAIDQTAPVRMRRSNVATYSGVYEPIREIFSRQPAAREKGLGARHFSFNVKGGRCERCEGMGSVRSSMLFFEDMEVPCPTCGGKRFGPDVLSVRYNGLNIDDVLALAVEEAAEVFSGQAPVMKALRLLMAVGLGYLQLGQSLTTLSGGEAQRMKLSKALLDGRGERCLYLIDEPTTGLHPLDVAHFIALLDEMVDAGNTVVVVEHNQQLIRASDWVIDLGPGGGAHGGRIVAEGTPRDIAASTGSITGRYLYSQ